VRAPRRILVHHPEEAADYARLIRLPRRGLELAVSSNEAEAARAIGETEILYAWNFPPPLLARAPRLRWIQNMGAGVERFLVPELASDVILTRVAGIFGPWMAEYTLGWALWTTQKMELGDIGRTIARSARALGMVVVGVSRSGRAVREAHRVLRTAALPRALAAADFVVLTVPLTDATRGLIDAAALAAMKPGAWLINVARGAVVDEAALVSALRERRIGGAVLDVFAEEPLPAAHPLWALDNAVITPHISGPSTPEEINPLFADNLQRYLTNRPLRHVADRRRGY